jgi:lysophospholipase L1-like esterase
MKSFLILLVAIPSLLFADKTIPASKMTYTIRGAHYSQINEQGMEFRRFPVDFKKLPSKELGFNMKKAETTSGASLLFKSNSDKIEMNFTTLKESENRGSDFALYHSRKLIKEYSFKKSQVIKIEINNPKLGEETIYELVLPSFSNPILQSFVIDDKSYIKADTSKQKKKYLAIGDSISHGVGQDSKSYKTYPYILSQKLDLQLYNLAVGGGKISPAISSGLKDFNNVKLITILIGYNDLKFQGKTVNQYIENYDSFLNKARKAHPHTQIVCISLLYTKTQESPKTKITPDEYRLALEQLISQKRQEGDKNLHFIAGDTISSAKDLRPDSSDPVHLGIYGASHIARELGEKISPILSK